jgi:hypothetical protein
VHQRVRAGAHRDAVRLEGVEQVGRDVLVVERHHVALGGEPPYRLGVLVVADGRVRDGLRG